MLAVRDVAKAKRRRLHDRKKEYHTEVIKSAISNPNQTVYSQQEIDISKTWLRVDAINYDSEAEEET